MADNRFAVAAGDDLEVLLEEVPIQNIFQKYFSAKKYRDFEKFTCSQLEISSPNFT